MPRGAVIVSPETPEIRKRSTYSLASPNKVVAVLPPHCDCSSDAKARCVLKKMARRVFWANRIEYLAPLARIRFTVRAHIQLEEPAESETVRKSDLFRDRVIVYRFVSG